MLVPTTGAGAKRVVTQAAPPASRSAGRHVDVKPKPLAAPGASAAVFPAVHATSGRKNAAALDPRVLQLALQSTTCAMSRGVIERRPATLTLIDYSRPSTQPRLWVLDLATGAVLFEELVAHGAGSGDNLATRFSNEADSHQSSVGLFTTEDTYIGKHGYSLRLHGLETGVNDRARERAIVIHGAPYVSATTATTLGRLGRSWGCPALRSAVVRDVIDRIKGGSVVFAYYPDPAWLSQSAFLTSCPATGNAA